MTSQHNQAPPPVRTNNFTPEVQPELSSSAECTVETPGAAEAIETSQDATGRGPFRFGLAFLLGLASWALLGLAVLLIASLF